MLLLVAAGGCPVAAQAPTKAPIEFDIPSQSLNSALGHYGDATGLEGLYDASLTRGRQSTEIRGRLTPEDALRSLLSGTGLNVEFVDARTFILLPLSAVDGRQGEASTRSATHQRYYGLVQASLLDVLCQSRSARPGSYRFAALFWIDPDGKVRRSRRLGSSGATDTDQKIDLALRRVRISEPPPEGFTQPVLMLIVPEEAYATGCEKAVPAQGIGR